MDKRFIFVSDGYLEKGTVVIPTHYTLSRITTHEDQQRAVEWLDTNAPDGWSMVYVGIDEAGFYYGASADIASLLTYDGLIMHIMSIDGLGE